MVEAHLEKLAAAGINLIPADLGKHFLFERDGFIALVERTPEDGFGRVGTAGLLTGKGLAPLMWRDNEAWFVGRGFEQAAEPGQVDLLRAFQADLEAALR